MIESSLWDDNRFLRGDFTYHQAVSLGAIFPTEHHVFNTDTPLSSGNYTPAQVSDNTLALASGYALETDLVFSDGRLVQWTGRSGIPITYLWGYSRSLPVAKIVGATYDASVVKANLTAP